LNFTIEDIRKALDAASPVISADGVIATGKLVGQSGEVDYTMHAGWDLQIANLCDRSWGAFNISLLRHIRSLDAGGVDIQPILESAQLEDYHWRWLDKSLAYRGDSYKWFFLVAEQYPQAACLIYHPKTSVVGAGDIFYVEYIATAPWNRENALAERVFKGVGPKLLDRVISYAQDKLKLRQGFSLHSLPKAEQFYEKLGMKAFQEYDKEGMKFFEWISPDSLVKG
jgi:GNAT superfamily N-acetyltransferase